MMQQLNYKTGMPAPSMFDKHNMCAAAMAWAGGGAPVICSETGDAFMLLQMFDIGKALCRYC